MFSFVFSNWFCATGTQLSSAEAGAVVLGDAVLRRGAVAGAIQRSATVFTPVVPASWLELALHVVAGQRSAMMQQCSLQWCQLMTQLIFAGHRSAAVFSGVPASLLELALHVVAGQRSAMMHS